MGTTRPGARAVLALVLCELLLLLSPSAAAADGGGLPRRSLHQPFFPIGWSPPPPASADVAAPPPPAAAAAATSGPARSAPSVTNIVAIALTAGLVALAVVSYSCVLLWRRVAEGAEDDRAAAKPAGALAARIPSDAGSSARHQTSPPPSSTASDAIYLDPLTAVMEVRHHRSSPDLRPLQLQKQPSPDLRPLPPLKRMGAQPTPPPAATPPMTGTEYSSSDEDQATFYTARKTNMSSFSRSTSQRSTMEYAVPPPVAPPPLPPAPAPAPMPPPPAPAPVPMPPTPAPAPAAPPPQANRLRPPRPPPLPRQRLLRPMPAESPPPAALANLALTSPPEASVQNREAESSDVQPGGSTRPPSLKPLHWDKLRAISGRTTVWDQVKNSDSFRVDEAAMENLFPQNSATAAAGNSGQAAARGGQHSRLLDPKRLQNVAIMLKALNVTADEVIGALLHGNLEDKPELYETLAKMAPTKEEELKLKDYSGNLSKIDPAERFLKDILNVPFAFKRVDAMLYRANFDAEVNYLKKSFGTMEAACSDLRSSNLFLKLLDAVLKTGNRMNDGTNRGEARAFKLDTLLKLADIKSTDGKTTLLHFVVQEIIRSEGFDSDQPETNNPGTGSASKERFKKDGLKVLAGLSSELSNVRKAATLEMDTLSGNLLRLATDLEKVRLVLQLRETCARQESSGAGFFESMDGFLGRAQAEIGSMKVAERGALQRVKETTQYFHGDGNMEEPSQPLRVFMVVTEFLLILDRVCRDVGRTPERVMMGSGKSFRVSAGTSVPPRRYDSRTLSSSDEDSSSS
ncbi:formin-like protein 13 [Triticum urartu]|uniref:Formin-like protein n=2 Tax=Triticum urartu TaxID=4572 RepID=A0A8R7TF63_TRIUA|nr:formin-like protein 13 [Triticum urartu]